MRVVSCSLGATRRGIDRKGDQKDDHGWHGDHARP